jgi:hypothetical protein
VVHEGEALRASPRSKCLEVARGIPFNEANVPRYMVYSSSQQKIYSLGFQNGDTHVGVRPGGLSQTRTIKNPLPRSVSRRRCIWLEATHGQSRSPQRQRPLDTPHLPRLDAPRGPHWLRRITAVVRTRSWC